MWVGLGPNLRNAREHTYEVIIITVPKFIKYGFL